MKLSHLLSPTKKGSTHWGLIVLFSAALILGLVFGARMRRDGSSRTKNRMAPYSHPTGTTSPADEVTEMPRQVPLLWEF
jgi:hypothetical protein